MRNDRIAQLLKRDQAGGSVTIDGWVRTCRHSKGFSFLEMNDGSTIHNIQCVVDGGLENYESVVKQLQTGASIQVTGELVDSPGKGTKI